jgi:hypothetical protein
MTKEDEIIGLLKEILKIAKELLKLATERHR